MAYLTKRPSGAYQIRESVRTPDGPRSRTLASFKGALDDRTLDEAEGRAQRPLDRAALIEAAREIGVAFASSADLAARELIGRLRSTRDLDRRLVGLLREQLAPMPDEPLPEELEEAKEWVGASARERASTLRGLLRLGDAIIRARDPRAPEPFGPYPRLSLARGDG